MDVFLFGLNIAFLKYEPTFLRSGDFVEKIRLLKSGKSGKTRPAFLCGKK